MCSSSQLELVCGTKPTEDDCRESSPGLPTSTSGRGSNKFTGEEGPSDPCYCKIYNDLPFGKALLGLVDSQAQLLFALQVPSIQWLSQYHSYLSSTTAWLLA